MKKNLAQTRLERLDDQNRLLRENATATLNIMQAPITELVGDSAYHNTFEHMGVTEINAMSMKLQKVDNARARIRRGIGDICEICSGKISKARQEALPDATTCIKCARKTEQVNTQS